MHPAARRALANVSGWRSFIANSSGLGFFCRSRSRLGRVFLVAMRLHFRGTYLGAFEQAVARIVDDAVVVRQTGQDLHFLAEITAELPRLDVDDAAGIHNRH